MEAKKSHQLSSRKASNIIQSKSAGLKIRSLMVQVLIWVQKPENQGCQRPRVGGNRCLSPSRETDLLFLHLFVLLGLDDAHIVESELYSVCGCIANPSGDAFTDVHRNNVLLVTWESFSPSRWHIKLVFTVMVKMKWYHTWKVVRHMHPVPTQY